MYTVLLPQAERLFAKCEPVISRSQDNSLTVDKTFTWWGLGRKDVHKLSLVSGEAVSRI